MKLCILENDAFDPGMAPHLGRLADAFAVLFAQVGAHWDIEAFHTPSGEYPASFDGYGAVVLTGSRADAFGSEPWVVELRRRVTALLAQRSVKIIGVCFGHQLLGVCLGAPVGRAPQGWGVGNTQYQWRGGSERSVLASHQDQVLELPQGATLLATSALCPIAGFTLGQQVYSLQPHPEMDTVVSSYLLAKRRDLLGEAAYTGALASLALPTDALAVAREMVAFVEADGGPISATFPDKLLHI